MYLEDSIKTSSELSSTTKLFLHTLASYADKNGICYPGQRTVAQAMSMSVATVKRCVQECLELKLLEVKRRWRKSNVYKLLCLKSVTLSTMGSLTEPREQPEFNKERFNAPKQRLWKSPAEIQVLLQDMEHFFGYEVAERNRGWFYKIAKTIEDSWLYETLSWLRQVMMESDIAGNPIQSPSALFTWKLRVDGAVV